jgi:hypothetical protein
VDTYRVRIDGNRVGPVLDAEDDAHQWVATHHPGERYSITTTKTDGSGSAAFYAPRR